MEKVGSFSLFPVLVEMPNASNEFPVLVEILLLLFGL